MKIMIREWGNSLALRIPKIVAMQLGISSGKEVELDLQKDAFVISKPEQTLNALLKNVTPENIHTEISTGDAIGKEIW